MDGKGQIAPDGDRASVFVSYSRTDKSQARQIIDLLESAGFQVWWDDALEPGATYVETTEQALESAEAVVVLWTKTSTGSNWVRDEAMSGRERNCLVPVSMDGSVAPLGFRQFQALDFSGWGGRATDPEARKLVASVAAMHGREVTAPIAAPAKPKISRRGVLAGGVVVIAAGLAGVVALNPQFFGSEVETNSIAVLPFRNLGGDPEQEYFSAGLAEELRITLSLNRRLLVAAETSSRIFEEATDNVGEVAERLGVAYVLEGSVRRSAETLRITARLVDVASGFEVWSKLFERGTQDTLDLSSELATSVVDELFATRDDGVVITQRPGGTQDSEALDHYLHGLALFRSAASEETDREALAEFERAIAIDPGYAVGHATYGWGLAIVAAAHSSGDELAAAMQQAEGLARRAIELEPDAPEGHAALGIIRQYDLDLRGAREPYQTSFELGFGNAQIIAAFAQFSAYVGEFDAASDAIARALRIDPLNAQVFRTAALIEYLGGNYDGARDHTQTALSLNPEAGGLQWILGDIALLSGDFEAAREFYTRESAPLPRLRGLAIVEERISGREAGDARIAELVAEFGDNSLYQQAQVFAMWGENDAALDALEAGFARGDTGLPMSGVDPLLARIRQDPRFAAIQGRLGLA